MISEPHKRQRPAGTGRQVEQTQLDAEKHTTTIEAIPATGCKLPPFGREVIEAIQAGRSINAFVFTGARAWTHAKRRRASVGPGQTLLVPFDADPVEFLWPALKNCTIVGDSYGQVFRTAHVIVSRGTALAMCIYGNASHGLIVRGAPP